jgi:membrane protein YqaA with SNARE-associated domain
MEWLANLGYFGLFLGTFLSGTVFPLNSDILLIAVLTLGGDPWLCMLFAIAGNWSGVMTSYLLGWIGKWEWLEKYFNVKPEKIEKQKQYVEKYGVWIALVPFIPVIGTVGMIALGFYKTKPKTTALLLLTGCFLRFFLWTVLYVNFGGTFIEWIKGFIPLSY